MLDELIGSCSRQAIEEMEERITLTLADLASTQRRFDASLVKATITVVVTVEGQNGGPAKVDLSVKGSVSNPKLSPGMVFVGQDGSLSGSPHQGSLPFERDEDPKIRRVK
jgi:hypothetical protein